MALEELESSNYFTSGDDGSNFMKIYREDLYDNNKPLLTTSKDNAHYNAASAKFRLFSVIMEVSNMVSVPGLGVGMMVVVEQGGSNVSKSSHDGPYVVKEISHNHILSDRKMFYYQNVTLARPG